jgi:hypothetical protein
MICCWACCSCERVREVGFNCCVACGCSGVACGCSGVACGCSGVACGCSGVACGCRVVCSCNGEVCGCNGTVCGCSGIVCGCNIAVCDCDGVVCCTSCLVVIGDTRGVVVIGVVEKGVASVVVMEVVERCGIVDGTLCWGNIGNDWEVVSIVEGFKKEVDWYKGFIGKGVDSEDISRISSSSSSSTVKRH